GSALVRRARLAAGRRRRGRVAGRARRRLPRVRRRHAARADGAAPGRWAGLRGEPLRRARAARPLRPRPRPRRSARGRARRGRGAAEVLAGERDEAGRLLDGPPPVPPRGGAARGGLRRFPERGEHLRRVERAKEHIREGDVFQVVIAQRAERPTSASAFELYRALRRVNPSPYLFLLELDGLALVGSSPETVVKCEGTRAALNPIAGTI